MGASELEDGGLDEGDGAGSRILNTVYSFHVTDPRILPQLSTTNRPYWTGGATGQLLVERCTACRTWQHPPTGTCEQCGGEAVAEPVSGRGTVFTFTVNHQQYHPDVAPPYVIAVVELVEQADLRVPTNIVGCDPDDVVIGAAVQVRFEQHDDVFVPVFVLAPDPADREPADREPADSEPADSEAA